MFLAIKPNFKITAKNVQELFAFMRIRFAAAASCFYAKKMRLHGCLPPGQKLHADTGSGLENFSLAGPDKAGIFRGCFKERKNIGPVETRDAAQRGNGRTHLAAFKRAEKANGNFGGARHLCK